MLINVTDISQCDGVLDQVCRERSILIREREKCFCLGIYLLGECFETHDLIENRPRKWFDLCFFLRIC